MRLKIETDSNLYDQELTLLLPTSHNISPVKVIQNEIELKVIQLNENKFISNIKPVNSEIQIWYQK